MSTETDRCSLADRLPGCKHLALTTSARTDRAPPCKGGIQGDALGLSVLGAVAPKNPEQLDRVSTPVLVRLQRPNHYQELDDVANGHASTAHEHADLDHTATHHRLLSRTCTGDGEVPTLVQGPPVEKGRGCCRLRTATRLRLSCALRARSTLTASNAWPDMLRPARPAGQRLGPAEGFVRPSAMPCGELRDGIVGMAIVGSRGNAT
jgi:hypothetical protein